MSEPDFSEIEVATMDYLAVLWNEFGEGTIELSLPRNAYRGLLSSLLKGTNGDLRVYAYEYDRFTWDTMVGPVVVRMIPG